MYSTYTGSYLVHSLQHFEEFYPKCQLENQFIAQGALKLICVIISYKAY